MIVSSVNNLVSNGSDSIEELMLNDPRVNVGHFFITPSKDDLILFEKSWVYLNLLWRTINSNHNVLSDFGIRTNVDWYGS